MDDFGISMIMMQPRCQLTCITPSLHARFIILGLGIVLGLGLGLGLGVELGLGLEFRFGLVLGSLNFSHAMG